MRISLSEFGLPGKSEHFVPGDVVYTGIAYDVNSGVTRDDFTTHAYLACGYRKDDGMGVLVHGTPVSMKDMHYWRVPRLLSAPSDPDAGLTVTSTEFHGVESLQGPYVRLVGCVETAEKPGLKQGFLYEGWLDGTGDWYPINIDGADGTVVQHSCGDSLVCRPVEVSDELHVYDLQAQKWTKHHTGFATEWEIDEVIPADGLYVIRGKTAGGKEFTVVHRP